MMEKEELEENLPLTANLIPFNQQYKDKEQYSLMYLRNYGVFWHHI